MNIVILTKAPFPDGAAVSTYVLNVCRAITASGNHVTVLGCRRGLKTEYPVSGAFEGIDYINFDAVHHNKAVVYLYDRYWDQYAKHRLSKIENTNLVFLYGGTRSTARSIYKYCKKNGMEYGAFNCEWYTKDCFVSENDARTVENMTELNPFNAKHADKAILISSLLYGYYTQNGVKSIMIPNIVDLNDKKWDVRKIRLSTDKLRIAYAGVPGVGKDELGTVIEAIDALPLDIRENIEFNIWGPTPEQMDKYMGAKREILGRVKNSVIIHGRAVQEDIPRFLNECHFTILIRKPSLRTNAGFSTKMVESFAAGVPMIANITGDIGTYLKDGVNGIVVEDDTVKACTEALRRALNLLDKNDSLRERAKQTAELYFDYRQYINSMKGYLLSAEESK